MTQDRAAFARRWLMTLSAIALAIIFIGGLTRLTGSGLSITEWRPVSGALPPISHLEWEQEFAKYREIPSSASPTPTWTLRGSRSFIGGSGLIANWAACLASCGLRASSFCGGGFEFRGATWRGTSRSEF